MVTSDPKILMSYENKGLLLSMLSQAGSLSLHAEVQLMENLWLELCQMYSRKKKVLAFPRKGLIASYCHKPEKSHGLLLSSKDWRYIVLSQGRTHTWKVHSSSH